MAIRMRLRFFHSQAGLQPPANGFPVTGGAGKPHLATTHQLPDGVGPQSLAPAFVSVGASQTEDPQRVRITPARTALASAASPSRSTPV